MGQCQHYEATGRDATLIACKRCNELLPGLYPGWKVTQDFTCDMLWIEGPQGYEARIPRTALEDLGCGLDGVMEFILQKDARLKREASLQVSLQEQVRRQVEREQQQEQLQQQEAQMCAKGYDAAPVDPAKMAAREDYLRYLALARAVSATEPAEVEVEFQDLPDKVPEQGRLYNKARAAAAAEPHKPWNGVREVDLD